MSSSDVEARSASGQLERRPLLSHERPGRFDLIITHLLHKLGILPKPEQDLEESAYARALHLHGGMGRDLCEWRECQECGTRGRDEEAPRMDMQRASFLCELMAAFPHT